MQKGYYLKRFNNAGKARNYTRIQYLGRYKRYDMVNSNERQS